MEDPISSCFVSFDRTEAVVSAKHLLKSGIFQIERERGLFDWVVMQPNRLSSRLSKRLAAGISTFGSPRLHLIICSSLRRIRRFRSNPFSRCKQVKRRLRYHFRAASPFSRFLSTGSGYHLVCSVRLLWTDRQSNRQNAFESVPSLNFSWLLLFRSAKQQIHGLQTFAS